ncbi:hypothetical protein E2C01_043362 [Portunus trituberculatus]|uniref:Uncharacterized protein n=1 Tax=Portunus trituberculatus TaxID=210409 RepID=A0A5B7FW72_PORTR|nr:hypothetical protein [Portunus trituberculatus]
MFSLKLAFHNHEPNKVPIHLARAAKTYNIRIYYSHNILSLSNSALKSLHDIPCVWDPSKLSSMFCNTRLMIYFVRHCDSQIFPRYSRASPGQSRELLTFSIPGHTLHLHPSFETSYLYSKGCPSPAPSLRNKVRIVAEVSEVW